MLARTEIHQIVVSKTSCKHLWQDHETSAIYASALLSSRWGRCLRKGRLYCGAGKWGWGPLLSFWQWVGPQKWEKSSVRKAEEESKANSPYLKVAFGARLILGGRAKTPSCLVPRRETSQLYTWCYLWLHHTINWFWGASMKPYLLFFTWYLWMPHPPKMHSEFPRIKPGIRFWNNLLESTGY